MRRLIESTLISLDGVIESPDRCAPFDDESAAFAMEQLDGYDGFVMGRVTYERLSANWAHVVGNPYNRETGGERGYRWRRGTEILLLTTAGRHSDEPRTTPLIHRTDGDRWIIVASNGGSPNPPPGT
jgi:F420H(2)-dependent quinone reductase